MLSFSHLYYFNIDEKALKRFDKVGARYLSQNAPGLNEMNYRSKKENLLSAQGQSLLNPTDLVEQNEGDEEQEDFDDDLDSFD